MPHNRFFISSAFKKDEEIALTDSELHHLMVLRIGKEEHVELINGKGQLAQATLLSLDKKRALLRIDKITEERLQKTPIILAQGLPRMNHLEWIIEKATELGVTHFWLFPGHLSEKQTLSENQKTRLEHLILAGIKQCGRLDLPSLEVKPPLEKWTPLTGTLLYGDPSPSSPFLWEFTVPLSPPIVLFIGPESGFNARELWHLKNVLGAQCMRLHANTLRTETAALAALTLIQIFTQEKI